MGRLEPNARFLPAHYKVVNQVIEKEIYQINQIFPVAGADQK
jgi:hypothetical protein